ncbi:MAG: hypothetical protein KAT68_05855 [Bacteroidales bacterium]|nr:hypothetical protein [Bacteroidales bacterium]
MYDIFLFFKYNIAKKNQKLKGKYKVVKILDSFFDEKEIDKFYHQA